jgi:hypothetical protein
MNWIPDLLGIVEAALMNPEDKAAVQIAIDGLAVWKKIAGDPQVLKLEADVGAYVALLPPGAVPEAPVAAPEPPASASGHPDMTDSGRMPPGM